MASKVRVQVQPMAEAHIPSVMEIEHASNPSPWSEASIRGELKNAQASYFVAIADNQIRGFCGYWKVIDEAHITNVAVHPDCRRAGIGRSLIKHALEQAQADGIRCATLEVRRNNEAAIKLYESFGFVQSAIRKGYYPKDSQDAIVMWLYDLGGKS